MNIISNKTFWLTDQCNYNPNKIFIKDETKDYSFLEINFLSQKAVSFLLSAGVKKSDHVSILTENKIEFIVLINALWFLGAIPIPLNTKLTINEIQKLIEYSDSKFLISLNEKKSSIKLKEIIDLNFSLNIINHLTAQSKLEKFKLSNFALFMYSSGSTGRPKCVKLTFNNLYSSYIASNSFILHKKDDVWFASLPFFHIGGFSIFTRSLLAGCNLYLIKDISLKNLVKNIIRTNPTLISLVPTMLVEMINKNISVWKRLRMIFIGGGPSSEKNIIDALQKNYPLAVVYGATETSSMVTYASTNELIINAKSVGKPLRGVKISLVDNNGKKCKMGKVGEIVIKSESVSSGYYNLKQNMDSALRDGKFFTNDLAQYDREGNLILIGRKDDIIISGGENFNLSEIHNVILNTLDIKDCFCEKIKSDKWGESYTLFISPKTNKHYSHKEIMDLLKSNFAKFKLPQNIKFVEAIPRNELGKLTKNF